MKEKGVVMCGYYFTWGKRGEQRDFPLLRTALKKKKREEGESEIALSYKRKGKGSWRKPILLHLVS